MDERCKAADKRTSPTFPETRDELKSAKSRCLTHSKAAPAALVGNRQMEGESGARRAGFAGWAVVLGRPEVAYDAVAGRNVEMGRSQLGCGRCGGYALCSRCFRRGRLGRSPCLYWRAHSAAPPWT